MFRRSPSDIQTIHLNKLMKIPINMSFASDSSLLDITVIQYICKKINQSLNTHNVNLSLYSALCRDQAFKTSLQRQLHYSCRRILLITFPTEKTLSLFVETWYTLRFWNLTCSSLVLCFYTTQHQ